MNHRNLFKKSVELLITKDSEKLIPELYSYYLCQLKLIYRSSEIAIELNLYLLTWLQNATFHTNKAQNEHLKLVVTEIIEIILKRYDKKGTHLSWN